MKLLKMLFRSKAALSFAGSDEVTEEMRRHFYFLVDDVRACDDPDRRPDLLTAHATESMYEMCPDCKKRVVLHS